MFWAAEISAATSSVGSMRRVFHAANSTARRANNAPTPSKRWAIAVDSSRVASPITSMSSTSPTPSNT